jgi:hypothetical protein
MKSGIASLLGGLGIAAVMVWSGTCDLAAAADSSLALEWNPSPDPHVAGYLVEYRASNGSASNSVNAGTNTTTTITGLLEGETYLFVARAYDADGRRSAPSNELSYTVPAPGPPLEAGKVYLSRNTQTDGIRISFLVSQGVIYLVQATQDFQSWVTVTSVAGALSQAAIVEDPQASSFSQRFYRVVQAP